MWGSDPETLIASAFAFKSGRGRAVEGGYFIAGDWQFSSGSNLCQWIVLGTPIYEADAQTPSRMLWCLLPKRDWEIVDVWFAAGLKGTASNDIRVAGAFVPNEFTLDTSLCDGRPTPGSAINPSVMYRLPLWPIFSFNVSTPARGVARGALDAYVEYMGSRPEPVCPNDNSASLNRRAKSTHVRQVERPDWAWPSCGRYSCRSRGRAALARIYISSTYEDLQECRAAVADALRRLKHEVIAMEAYVASDQRPLDRCLRDVEASDIYVGIFAWRYGYIPEHGNPEHRSITELEFRHAVNSKKPCLMFLLAAANPWPRELMDVGAEAARIENLRTELERDFTVSFFGPPLDLAEKVNSAVSVWLEEQRGEGLTSEPPYLSEGASGSTTSPLPREVTRDVLIAYSDIDKEFAFQLSSELKRRQRGSLLSPRALFAEGERELVELEMLARQCHSSIVIVSDASLGVLERRGARMRRVLDLLQARSSHLIAVCRGPQSLQWAKNSSFAHCYETPVPTSEAHDPDLLTRLDRELAAVLPPTGVQAIGLPIVVVTMTADEATRLANQDSMATASASAFGLRPGREFEALRATLERFDSAAFVHRYGTTREDWKPFAESTWTIREVIGQVVEYLNGQQSSQLQGLWLKPQYYPLQLDPTEARDLRHVYNEVAQSGCVVIVDDVSMFDRDVRDAFWSSPMFNSLQAALVTISPMNPTGLAPVRLLESDLWTRLRVAFDRFEADCDPQCEFGVADERRLRRWLHNALPLTAQSLREPRPNRQSLDQFAGSVGARAAGGMPALLYRQSGAL